MKVIKNEMQKTIFTGGVPDKEVFQVFTETMEELFLEDPTVVYIDADLMASMRIGELWEKYPNNMFNTGIQEANMACLAAGMSLTGLKPYIHTFAPFASRRDLDQLYISVGYANTSVRVIGSEPGICAADNGGTHMCFEDIAIMRSIPNACIIDVSDAKMLSSLLKITKERRGITYFRTPRRGLPDIYPENTKFEIGKGKALRAGTDVTIIASGIMVATALDATRELACEGVHALVVDPVTIKPLDEPLIIDCAKETGAIVTAENHNITGGLGGAVAELLMETFPVPMVRVGINDRFGQVGNEAYLRREYSLEKEDIIIAAKKAISMKNG